MSNRRLKNKTTVKVRIKRWRAKRKVFRICEPFPETGKVVCFYVSSTSKGRGGKRDNGRKGK